MHTFYEDMRKEARENYDERMRTCASAIDPVACRSEAGEVYDHARQRLLDAEQAATEGRWGAELEALKELRQYLRDHTPGLKDLLEGLDNLIKKKEKVLVQGSFRNNGSLITLPVVSASTVVSPPPCLQGTLTFTGSLGAEHDGVSENGTVIAEMDLGDCAQVNGKAHAIIKGGFLKLTHATDGTKIFGSVDTSGDDESFVEYTASGDGVLHVWIDVQANMGQWGHRAFGTLLYELPVRRLNDGTLGIGFGPTQRRYIPTYEVPASLDCNGDHALDFATDHAAFMALYQAQDPRADHDWNHVFNNDDIALWVAQSRTPARGTHPNA